MDLVKKYIIQSVSVASANLRLNSEKLEIITLIKDYLEKSESLEEEIIRMKKRTELSKFAIKLDQVHNYIAKGKPDFLYLSEKFKEQSASLITDLSYILDISTPQSINKIFDEFRAEIKTKAEETVKPEQIDEDEYFFEEGTLSDKQDRIKEKIIFSELKEKEKFSFEDYEELILKTVKDVEPLLKRFNTNEYTDEEIQDYENKIFRNAELSVNAGFSLLAEMHRIIYKALQLLRERRLLPVTPVIEGIRACLIVIVAVVRGKDVDITNYLNRAETFGEKINATKEEIS